MAFPRVSKIMLVLIRLHVEDSPSSLVLPRKCLCYICHEDAKKLSKPTRSCS